MLELMERCIIILVYCNELLLKALQLVFILRVGFHQLGELRLKLVEIICTPIDILLRF